VLSNILTIIRLKVIKKPFKPAVLVQNDFNLIFPSYFSKDMTLKCNEESRSLSSETFTKVSITNLRRQAVPDLSAEMGMNIFKKVCRLFYLCIV